MNIKEFKYENAKLRLKILDSIYKAKKGRIGGALSIIDFLTI